ncbi:ATP-binding protein [Sphaerisporangium sp. B11E5]|uniref:ATP-binding protein n=1 Tax=Sphaerisporangium sp. B11E5 TaxID=3153563 RepID=UPI00325E08AC
MEPAWSIWYGVGSRRFYAVATWSSPCPLLLKASTAEELRHLMREAERTAPYLLVPRAATSDTAVGASPVPRSTHTPHLTPHGAPMSETHHDDLRMACWDLTDDPSMIGEIRAMVREVLTTWTLSDLADDVILAVGELLANAVTYGRPPIRLSLWLTSTDLTVRVTDHDSGLPRHLDLDIEAVHGRGLTIVKSLVHDTGVIPLADPQGKTVWCRWHLSTQTVDASENTRPP